MAKIKNSTLSYVIGATLTALIVFGAIIIPVSAESGEGTDVFKVIVTLFGISSSTKDIVTMVNVGNETKVKVFNADNPDNEGVDKVTYVITFPGIAVDDNQPYHVCTIMVASKKIDCQEKNNSPLNRPEFVDIDISKKS